MKLSKTQLKSDVRIMAAELSTDLEQVIAELTVSIDEMPKTELYMVLGILQAATAVIRELEP